MKIGKIKPSATIAVQFPAGVEVSAIQHEGNLYLPAISLGEMASVEDVDEDEAPKKEAKKETKPAPEKSKEKEVKSKVYTEKEMMDMPTKELEKILLGLGVDPDETEGKNTNKKLRQLILEAQAEDGKGSDAGDDSSDDDAPEEKPKKGGKETADSVEKKAVVAILEDFDSGSLNKKKAISKLMEKASEEADEEKVKELLDSFEDDADADIDEVAEKIAAALSGEKPAPKKGKGKEKKEVLVEADDLEVGQRVSVYWEDQEDWFEGKVKSIKKGVITIAYDDDTEEPIDSENNTKIKLL